MIICGILFAAVERDYKHWSLGHRAVVVVVDIFSAFFPFFYLFFFWPEGTGIRIEGASFQTWGHRSIVIRRILSTGSDHRTLEWLRFRSKSPLSPPLPLPLFHHAEWPWYWEKPPLLTPFLWVPLIAGCALVVAVSCRCHLQLLIKWISLYY